jgi:predicted ester cyclase
MSEEHKAVMRRFVGEVVNGRRTAPLAELVSADVIDHTPVPMQAPGAEGLKQALAYLRVAFPYAHSAEEEVVAEDDLVVYRGTLRGRHTGEFLGLQPTGREFAITEVRIARIADDRIAEHWWLPDLAALLRRLSA